MKVLMQMTWEGVKPEQYEQMRKSVNWEGNVPEGAIFHVSGFSDNAIHVTDIWESAEQFGHFAETRLKPGAHEAKVGGEPHISLVPVHATFVPEPAQLS